MHAPVWLKILLALNSGGLGLLMGEVFTKRGVLSLSAAIPLFSQTPFHSKPNGVSPHNSMCIQKSSNRITSEVRFGKRYVIWVYSYPDKRIYKVTLLYNNNYCITIIEQQVVIYETLAMRYCPTTSGFSGTILLKMETR